MVNERSDLLFPIGQGRCHGNRFRSKIGLLTSIRPSCIHSETDWNITMPMGALTVAIWLPCVKKLGELWSSNSRFYEGRNFNLNAIAESNLLSICVMFL